MSSYARGEEVPPTIVLHDEDGQPFTFVPVRALRNGGDVLMLAEREGSGTLHVLEREGDVIGLVRDRATLRRVALRLEILRGAMEGELIEWTDGERHRFFGVFHRGEVKGRAYLLAADLEDPATVVAFEPLPSGVRPADARFVASIREQMMGAALPWEETLPNLEAWTLGLRRERVEVTEPSGRRQAFETAGRFFFEGRDVLFLRLPGTSDQAFAVEVKNGGHVEPLADDALLARLRAHVADVSRRGAEARG